MDDVGEHPQRGGKESVLDGLVCVEIEEQILELATPDEKQVLQLIKEGHTQLEAAHRLHLAPDQVYQFMHRLREKIRARWPAIAASLEDQS